MTSHTRHEERATPVGTDVRGQRSTPSTDTVPLTVLGLAVLTTLLRLPILGAPVSADEGGFLMVARQWRPGSSLYGDYWVDRPPLLVALFQGADALGGLPALRLLGCLAAGLTVLAVGLAGHRAAGPVAATWSAAVAGGLLVSPLIGVVQVNGELLAAPFVAGGVWLAILAVQAPERRIGWAALGAGACAAAAVLVKQNMLDVVVFGGALGLLCLRQGILRAAELRRLALWFGAGGLVTVVAVLGLAGLRGTSPGGVLFAMYPFRLDAAFAAGHVTPVERLFRLARLGGAELLTGAPLVLAALVFVMLAVRRRPGPPPWPRHRPLAFAVAVAALALTAYDVVSVVVGGSYWLHYLVQLTIPAALAAGLVAVATPRPGRALVVVVLVSATLAWTASLVRLTPAEGEAVGTAIGRAAKPGDTMVSAFGDANIPFSAGLASPYPYLWSLPARTLDTRFRHLGAVLAGPDAPTWLVARGPTTLALLDQHSPGVALRGRYHHVGEVCGRAIYLRDGVHRRAPVFRGGCRQPVSTWFLEAGIP